MTPKGQTILSRVVWKAGWGDEGTGVKGKWLGFDYQGINWIKEAEGIYNLDWRTYEEHPGMVSEKHCERIKNETIWNNLVWLEEVLSEFTHLNKNLIFFFILVTKLLVCNLLAVSSRDIFVLEIVRVDYGFTVRRKCQEKLKDASSFLFSRILNECGRRDDRLTEDG